MSNGLDHHWQIQTASAPLVRSTTPGDGSTGVPADAALAVTFSSAMKVDATAGAISLSPPVPGTTVAPNATDHSRFVVLPGQLLSPGTTYTLTIGTGAADEHGQRLPAVVAARFTAGTLSAAGHALVLARAAGEPPSVLELTRRAPDQAGDPVAGARLVTAPRCEGTGCAPPGALVSSYVTAAASPSGSRIALVERLADGSPDRLVLVDVPSLREQVLAAPGDLPSWSADGSLLAFAAGGDVDLYDVATGTTSRLPDGDPLVAPAAWSADGSRLALTVQHRGAAPHVELADPALRIRYAVPGVAAAADSPALSPDGSVLALRVEQPVPGASLVRLSAADAAPQPLGATLTPLAWTDQATLLGVDRPAAGTPSIVRINVAGGDVARLGTGPQPSDLSTVATDVGGRTVGYLLPDAAGVLQAWAMNQDGSNPTQLTHFGPADGLEAVAVSLGG